MNVIGHDHVTPHKPRRGVFPNIHQQRVYLMCGQPGIPVPGADRVVDDGGLSFDGNDPLGSLFALATIWRRRHGSAACGGKRWERQLIGWGLQVGEVFGTPPGTSFIRCTLSGAHTKVRPPAGGWFLGGRPVVVWTGMKIGQRLFVSLEATLSNEPQESGKCIHV
jgi:hypothetical protein